MRKLFISMMVGGLALAAAPAFAATCSNGQTISNTTLQHLEVTTGFCFVDHVTVNLGITVHGGGVLQLTNSTVNGGNFVQPKSGCQANPTSGFPLLGSSLINGGIVLTNGDSAVLTNSRINGGVSITSPGGRFTGFGPILCGLDIHGGVTTTNANRFGIFIGLSPLGSCPKNSIDGSVTIDNSIVESLENATIKGSLVCINGGVVRSHTGDTITGSNSCF
jgi:hypothetical protein